MKNYYELLGVEAEASKQEIKKSYLGMLKQYHPDVFKGNKTIAQEFSAQLNAAFDTLSNPIKRLDYDKTIFSKVNYTYDEDGLKVFELKNKQAKTFASKIEKSSLTKSEKIKLKKQEKKESKQEKKQKQFDKKQAKKLRKQQAKKQKQAIKENKNAQIKNKKKSLSYEKTYQAGKRKLEVAIVVISCVLIVFFGFIIYLRVTYSN